MEMERIQVRKKSSGFEITIRYQGNDKAREQARLRYLELVGVANKKNVNG